MITVQRYGVQQIEKRGMGSMAVESCQPMVFLTMSRILPLGNTETVP
jgi:hypothetical protein